MHGETIRKQPITSFPLPSRDYYEMVAEPAFLDQKGRKEIMAFRDRFSSSGSDVNLISENEPDDNFEDEPDLCLEEEEEKEIELAHCAPPDDQ